MMLYTHVVVFLLVNAYAEYCDLPVVVLLARQYNCVQNLNSYFVVVNITLV